jgi:hypothetical protein
MKATGFYVVVEELSGVPVLGSVEVDGVHCDGAGGASAGAGAGGGTSAATGGGDGGGLAFRAVFLLGFVFFFFIRFAFFFAPFFGLRFLGKQITRPIVEVPPVINLHRNSLGIPQFRVNGCVGLCLVPSHVRVSGA